MNTYSSKSYGHHEEIEEEEEDQHFEEEEVNDEADDVVTDTQRQFQQPPQIEVQPKKMRPQSAKTGDEQRFRFNQHNNNHYAPQWVQAEQHTASNPAMPGYIYPYPVQQQQNPVLLSNIKQLNQRPITANWNQKWTGGAKVFDQDANRLRPRVVNQEREQLYEDNLKQKLTANHLKDENLRLKTRIQMLEGELLKKDKLVGELIAKPEGKPKAKQVESHLTQNLKRRIKEMQIVIGSKTEELELVRRNMKGTRFQEMEVELRAFAEECQRLRAQLEEVIKSKDTFADPEELKAIEQRFQAQDMLIGQLRHDNGELAAVIARKEEETQKLRDFYSEQERRRRQGKSATKEVLKAKKQAKDREREVLKLADQLKAARALNDEQRLQLEEALAVKRSTSNRPQTASNQGERQLREELAEKEEKIKELNRVLGQLQDKLQEKQTLLQGQQAEKDKFKGLYEQYQEQVARLEAQLQSASVQSVAQKPESKPAVKYELVEAKAVAELALEFRLRLQANYMHRPRELLFSPFNPDSQVSIKQLKGIFESTLKIKESKALLLARYFIEPREGKAKPTQFSDQLTAYQALIDERTNAFVKDYVLYGNESSPQFKKYADKARKTLERYKDTLKETLQLEDYEEEGVISAEAFLDALGSLSIDGLDTDMLNFLLYFVFVKGGSQSAD